MRNYTSDEVLALLDQAVGMAEADIYAGLRGADNEVRLNSLDQLDMLDGVHKQIRIILQREETSQ